MALTPNPERQLVQNRRITNDTSIKQAMYEKFEELNHKLNDAIDHIQRHTKLPYVRLGEDFKKPDRGNTDLLKRLALEDQNESGEQLHNLPLILTYFYGRTKELRKMSEKLEAVHEIESYIFTLFGIGGVGKSSLAERYAKQSLHAQTYSAVFWIRSETLESIQDSFVEIACRLDFELAANIDLTTSKVKDWLTKTSEFSTSREEIQTLTDIP
jgi:hypothetical protein